MEFTIPTKLSWSQFLITGTIKFPSFKAVATPTLISFFMITLSLTRLELRIGNSAKSSETILVIT